MIANTNYGKVQGLDENGILSFKGVPYAKAPVGDLRFAPPRNPDPWIWTKDCTTYGNACVQDDVGTGWDMRPQGEDCLNLNIWTPTLTPTHPMAVYVYIHGGVFTVGSGNQGIFDGHNMSNDLGQKDMVVVDINYRLNAFGFMALKFLEAQALNDLDQPMVDATDKPIMTDGNWGILDQVKALQWIHKNIYHFGGDPTNVTIAGESAGSFSVSSLIISPATDPAVQSDKEPLFERAVMESGNLLGYDSISTYSKADEDLAIAQCREMILETLHAGDSETTVRYLRSEYVSPLLLAEWTRVIWDPLKQPSLETWNLMPCYDGWALPNDKVAAITEGKFRNVDIIYGWNTDEGYGFVPDMLPVTLEDFKNQIHWRMSIVNPQSYIDDLHGFYDSTENPDGLIPGPVSGSYYLALRQLMKLSAFASSSKEFVDQIISHDGTIHKSHWAYNFNYLFDYPAPYPTKNGAAHTAELAFIFGNMIHGNPLATAMSNDVMHYWTNFAKTGNPNSSDLAIKWLPDEEANEDKALWFKGAPLGPYIVTPNKIEFTTMDENDAVNIVANFYANYFNI